MSSTTPQRIDSLKDIQFAEILAEDEFGIKTLQHTVCTFIDEDDSAYFGTLNKPKTSIKLDEAVHCLRRISDSEVYPPAEDAGLHSTTEADAPQSDFVCPNITSKGYAGWTANAGSTVIADQFLATAKSYQFARDHPHPNIVTFNGCITKHGRIVALSLPGYSDRIDVEAETERHFTAAEQAKWMDQLRAALNHLHSLGYAHNSICVDSLVHAGELKLHQGNIILTGLDKCKPLGANIGPHEPDFTGVSSVDNDDKGLLEMEKWFSDPWPPQYE